MNEFDIDELFGPNSDDHFHTAEEEYDDMFPPDFSKLCDYKTSGGSVSNDSSEDVYNGDWDVILGALKEACTDGMQEMPSYRYLP